MQAIGQPARNTLANMAESSTLGGSTKLVSLGDVACNADSEAPRCFNVGHGIANGRFIVHLFIVLRTASTSKACRRRLLQICKNGIVIYPTSLNFNQWEVLRNGLKSIL